MTDTYRLFTRSTDLGSVVSDLANGYAYTDRDVAERSYPEEFYTTYEITVVKHEDLEYVGEITTVVEELQA